MGLNRTHGFDAYPFILLNLVLSCLAAMQGAILLIAAKRSDQISSELAEHDFETNCRSEELLKQLMVNFEALSAQHKEMQQELARVNAQLEARVQMRVNRCPDGYGCDSGRRTQNRTADHERPAQGGMTPGQANSTATWSRALVSHRTGTGQ
ncbi:serine phosphatase RsbU (regulator of sigma subunit) [Streptacidiphilus sp. MAP12-16]